MVTRSAVPSDAHAIADLLGELGYPATPTDVVARLARISGIPSATVIVAELDGVVAGLATGHTFPSIHDTPVVAWLTTLVVGSAWQSRGVGQRLVAAIESWARTAGAERISVSSGFHRERAHAFYERLAYERSGVRLTKRLIQESY